METEILDAQVVPPEAEAPARAAPEQRLKAKPKARNGLWGAVLGGLIAAGAGFALAQYVPNGWPLAGTEDLVAKIEKQTTQIDEVRAQIAGLPQPKDIDPTILLRIAALENQSTPDLTKIEARLGALEQGLVAIETLPADGTASVSAAIAGLRAEVQALKSTGLGNNGQLIVAETEAQLQEAQTAAQALKADAEALAQSARVQTGLGKLESALSGGASYSIILIEFGDVFGSVPAVLSENAETGVPSVLTLQKAFPAAARLALDSALRADMGKTWTERASSFLRSQTGARSLEPREGADPDAVLSRAEAAVSKQDLALALQEISALPIEAQSEFAEWRKIAETRIAAQAAILALAASIGK